jgi:RNA polymerase sigma-70 factor (ECF subfamily)
VGQDDLYLEARNIYGTAIERLVRAYEADSEKGHDLLQEIHIALWRSFAIYESRCSLRTWVYRVAHSAATTYVLREQRLRLQSLLSLEEIESEPVAEGHERGVEERMILERVLRLIHRLHPLDRQVMFLYLEDLDAAAIGEITGISAGNVRNKIYRIKMVLAQRFHGGEPV